MGLSDRVKRLEKQLEIQREIDGLQRNVTCLADELNAIKNFLGIKASSKITMIKEE